MRKLLLLFYAGILLIIAVMLGVWSYYLADNSGQQSFKSNLYLNFVPELIGAAIGIFIPLFIIAWFADKRLEKLAKPIVELIAQLRVEDRISKEAARRSVVCAVKLISDDNVKEDIISLSLVPKEHLCDVCDLKIEIREDRRCKHCGLKDNVWKLDNKPVRLPSH